MPEEARYGDEGAHRLEGHLYLPRDVVLAPDGSVYLVEWGNQRVRTVGRDDRVVTVAGSINDFGRLDEMKRLNPWAFTIGGAFFEGKFIPKGDFRTQLQAVVDYMAK